MYILILLPKSQCLNIVGTDASQIPGMGKGRGPFGGLLFPLNLLL